MIPSKHLEDKIPVDLVSHKLSPTSSSGSCCSFDFALRERNSDCAHNSTSASQTYIGSSKNSSSTIEAVTTNTSQNVDNVNVAEIPTTHRYIPNEETRAVTLCVDICSSDVSEATPSLQDSADRWPCKFWHPEPGFVYHLSSLGMSSKQQEVIDDSHGEENDCAWADAVCGTAGLALRSNKLPRPLAENLPQPYTSKPAQSKSMQYTVPEPETRIAATRVMSASCRDSLIDDNTGQEEINQDEVGEGTPERVDSHTQKLPSQQQAHRLGVPCPTGKSSSLMDSALGISPSQSSGAHTRCLPIDLELPNKTCPVLDAEIPGLARESSDSRLADEAWQKSSSGLIVNSALVLPSSKPCEINNDDVDGPDEALPALSQVAAVSATTPVVCKNAYLDSALPCADAEEVVVRVEPADPSSPSVFIENVPPCSTPTPLEEQAKAAITSAPNSSSDGPNQQARRVATEVAGKATKLADAVSEVSPHSEEKSSVIVFVKMSAEEIGRLLGNTVCAVQRATSIEYRNHNLKVNMHEDDVVLKFDPLAPHPLVHMTRKVSRAWVHKHRSLDSYRTNRLRHSIIVGNVDDVGARDAHVLDMQSRKAAPDRRILALVSPQHVTHTSRHAWSRKNTREAPEVPNGMIRGSSTDKDKSSSSFHGTWADADEDDDLQVPVLNLATPSIIMNRNLVGGREGQVQSKSSTRNSSAHAAGWRASHR